MIKFDIGMSLTNIEDIVNCKSLLPNYKKMIVNYCNDALENGECKISNELELSMLNSWLNNKLAIKMPRVSDKLELINTFQAN